MAEALRAEASLVTAASRMFVAPVGPVPGHRAREGSDFKTRSESTRGEMRAAPDIRTRARGESRCVRGRGPPGAAPRLRARVPCRKGRPALIIGASVGIRITRARWGFSWCAKGGQVRALSTTSSARGPGKKGDAFLQPGAYYAGAAAKDRTLEPGRKLKPRGATRVDAALCAVG